MGYVTHGLNIIQWTWSMQLDYTIEISYFIRKIIIMLFPVVELYDKRLFAYN